MQSKVRCAVKGCVAVKATVLVNHVKPNGEVEQVQMCKPCSVAYRAGQADGFNYRRELEIAKAVMNAGY